MAFLVYSLERNAETPEFHLFQGKIIKNKIGYEMRSLCGEMAFKNSVEALFDAEDIDRAKKICDEAEANICEACVGVLARIE